MNGIRWYVQARGQLPHQDYVWRQITGDDRDVDETGWLSAAKPWASSAGAVLLRVRSGDASLFVDRLRHETWPRDHQGRPITAAIVGTCDADPASIRELARIASAAAAGRPMAAQALTFDPKLPGGFSTGPVGPPFGLTPPGGRGSPPRPGDRSWGPDRETVAGMLAVWASRRDPLEYVGHSDFVAVVSDMVGATGSEQLRPVMLASSRFDVREVSELPPKAASHQSQNRWWRAALVLAIAILAISIVVATVF